MEVFAGGAILNYQEEDDVRNYYSTPALLKCSLNSSTTSCVTSLADGVGLHVDSGLKSYYYATNHEYSSGDCNIGWIGSIVPCISYHSNKIKFQSDSVLGARTVFGFDEVSDTSSSRTLTLHQLSEDKRLAAITALDRGSESRPAGGRVYVVDSKGKRAMISNTPRNVMYIK